MTDNLLRRAAAYLCSQVFSLFLKGVSVLVLHMSTLLVAQSVLAPLSADYRQDPPTACFTFLVLGTQQGGQQTLLYHALHQQMFNTFGDRAHTPCKELC